MAKYDERFKQKLIDEYLEGGVSCRGLAARHGLRHSILQRWLAAYRIHGSAALRPGTVRHDAQFRMQVLNRMWRDRLSLARVAALYDIRDVGQVARWARLYDEGGVPALESRPRGRPRNMIDSQPDKPTEDKAPDSRTREELLKEIEYLRAEVAYLKKLDALLEAKKRAAPKKKRK